MSTRTMRVCDEEIPGSHSEPSTRCDRAFFAVCPFCQQDRCKDHFRQSITQQLRVEPQGTVIAAGSLVAICSSCALAVTSLPHAKLAPTLDVVNGAVESFRAAIAAHALTTDKKP
jgi:hypothetical protein